MPVAILTTEEFDAAEVNPDTVQLAGSSVAIRGNGSRTMASLTDVDGDADVDLMLHVSTENLALDTSATLATLTGETWDGEAIEGSDVVTIVPPNQSTGRKPGDMVCPRAFRHAARTR